MGAYPFKPVKGGGHQPSAGQLWKRVTPERRLQAAKAFWSDKEAATHVEAMVEMARHLKFRPKSVEALPLERRVRYLAGMPALSDSVAGQVLVAYHLAHQRPMMGAFLDRLGIPHDNGVITDPDKLEAPDPAKLSQAVSALFESQSADDVELYLSTLAVQDVAIWGGVIDLLIAREAKSGSGEKEA